MDGTIIFGFAAALFIMFIIGKVMMVPLRHVLKLIANGVVGGILLWVVNFFGATFSLYVPINIITALVAGFLGIPGVILLVGLKAILA